jgi:hypothetical protein
MGRKKSTVSVSKQAARIAEIKMANPGISWDWLINLLAALINPILSVLTPLIRTELDKWTKDMLVKARETPNPWDNWLFETLRKLLGLPID